MSIVAVTGAGGFIGKNLVVRLAESGHRAVAVPHDINADELAEKLKNVDFIVHLAGVNRPETEAEFETGNAGMSLRLVEALALNSRTVPLVYASSIQAALDNPYGRSKKAAEDVLRTYGEARGETVHIWRLPNVFGKWCRPNYNSVVATFCHNIARGLPLTISDPEKKLSLIYIDDVIDGIIGLVEGRHSTQGLEAQPVYETTLGDLALQLERFRDSRQTLTTDGVGRGFLRALHATYLSYLDPADFAYDIVSHTDPRGSFAEVLRTDDAGQFSFFTAHPGITRGGHYHHSKTEKFLVVQGKARFQFRHIITDEIVTLETDQDKLKVVETVPGWSHDITNIGDNTMIVMLWANEVFNREKPDTIIAKVLPQ